MEIYKITNLINNKIYIGKTVGTAEERFKRHCRDAKGNIKNTDYFHLALRKYGLNNFKVEIVETNIENKELLSQREIYWIDYYNSYNSEIGYNLTKGGTGGALTGEALERMRKSKTGQKTKPESIAKRIATFKKIGLNKGEKNGVNKPGVKEKISNSLKEYYKNNPIESKSRISNSLKAYYKNHSAWNKGKKDCYSTETKNRISNSLKEYYKNNPKKLPSFRGHHHTEQTKQKLKNKHWYNDGINTYFCEDNIAELNSYKKGRLNYRRKENGK